MYPNRILYTRGQGDHTEQERRFVVNPLVTVTAAVADFTANTYRAFADQADEQGYSDTAILLRQDANLVDAVSDYIRADDAVASLNFDDTNRFYWAYRVSISKMGGVF
jgi:hypothetical protein